MTRLNLNDAVDDLAPLAPPCFTNRLEWVQYLKSAAASQNDRGEPRIVILNLNLKREPVINFDYPFCQDCTQVHSLAMTKVGRCQPQFLKDQQQHEQQAAGGD